jgi:hypothetical protein
MNTSQRSINSSIILRNSKRNDRKSIVQIAIFISLFWIFINCLILLSMSESYSTRYKRDRTQDSTKTILSLKNDVDPHAKEITQFKFEEKTDPERRHIQVLGQVDKKSKISNEIESTQKEVGVDIPYQAFEVIGVDYRSEVTNPPNLPGEMGSAVVLPENLIAEAKRRFKENEFNVVASDLVALNRSLPDPFTPEERA